MFNIQGWILIGLLIAGGLLGASGLIVGKKPEAKELIAKLVPYQASIGVALLGIGIWNLLRGLSSMSMIFKIAPLFGVALYGSIICAVLLGFFFGMPQIAKWLPGDSPAEEKAEGLAKKLAPFQGLLGLVSIGCAVLLMLYGLKILKVL